MYNARMSRIGTLSFMVVMLFFVNAEHAFAQEFAPDTVTTAGAEVLEVISQE